MKKRVVDTGIGVLSIAGMDKESFWQGLINGESSFSEISGGFWGESFSGLYGILDKEKLRQYPYHRSRKRKCTDDMAHIVFITEYRGDRKP